MDNKKSQLQEGENIHKETSPQLEPGPSRLIKTLKEVFWGAVVGGEGAGRKIEKTFYHNLQKKPFTITYIRHFSLRHRKH